jgi:hypothetical protein
LTVPVCFTSFNPSCPFSASSNDGPTESGIS